MKSVYYYSLSETTPRVYLRNEKSTLEKSVLKGGEDDGTRTRNLQRDRLAL